MNDSYNHPPKALGPAKDHDELRLLMNANNNRFGRKFHYFDFHVFKGKLWCMFEIKDEVLKRVVNGKK
jgi:hypothetical protein